MVLACACVWEPVSTHVCKENSLQAGIFATGDLMSSYRKQSHSAEQVTLPTYVINRKNIQDFKKYCMQELQILLAQRQSQEDSVRGVLVLECIKFLAQAPTAFSVWAQLARELNLLTVAGRMRYVFLSLSEGYFASFTGCSPRMFVLAHFPFWKAVVQTKSWFLLPRSRVFLTKS